MDQQTVQSLIPIYSIYNELIETKDGRLTKVLSVTAVNTTLMSYAEEKEVLEGYENFLKNLRKPIQITRVAEPIDLTDYIRDLKLKMRATNNPYRRQMLQSYVNYAAQLQEDRDIIRRNRYVIIDEKFTDARSKEEAIRNLRRRASDLKLAIEEMLYRHKLEVHELNNEELKRYIHTLYDYENAQLTSWQDERSQAYVIGQRNLVDAAERVKQREDYLL